MKIEIDQLQYHYAMAKAHSSTNEDTSLRKSKGGSNDDEMDPYQSADVSMKGRSIGIAKTTGAARMI